MIHKRQALDFRVTEWPFATGSMRSVFPVSKQDTYLGDLCIYIAGVLNRLKRPMHHAVTFSLVNVTRPDVYSYGSRTYPSSTMFNSNVKLSFTFALSHLEQQGKFKHVYSNVWLWGNNTMLTLNLTMSDMHRFNCPTPLLTDLAYLYKGVGMFTKNFVRRPRWLNSTEPKVSLAILSKDLYMPLPQVIKTRSYSNWVYCRNVWIYAQQYLTDDSLNTDIKKLYYVMHLRDIPLTAMTNTVTTTNSSVIVFVTRGLRHCQARVQRKSTDIGNDKATIAALFLLAAERGVMFAGDIELDAINFLYELVAKEAVIETHRKYVYDLLLN